MKSSETATKIANGRFNPEKLRHDLLMANIQKYAENDYNFQQVMYTCGFWIFYHVYSQIKLYHSDANHLCLEFLILSNANHLHVYSALLLMSSRISYLPSKTIRIVVVRSTRLFLDSSWWCEAWAVLWELLLIPMLRVSNLVIVV